MSRPTRARIVIRDAGAIEYRLNLIDYGATWKYKIGAHDHDTGFEDPDFDDSSWSEAPAAFGHVSDGEQVGGPSSPPCHQNDTIIQTAWEVNTDLCLRATITLPSNVTRIYFEFGIDNIGQIYLNGDLIQETTNVGCQTRGTQSFWYDSPPTGTVVLAIRCRDPHPVYDVAPYIVLNDTFFDMKVDVVGPDAPTYIEGNALDGVTLSAGSSGTAPAAGCGTYAPANPTRVSDADYTANNYSLICNGVTNSAGLRSGYWVGDLGTARVLGESRVFLNSALEHPGSGTGEMRVYASNTGTSGPWTLVADYGHIADGDPNPAVETITDPTAYRYVKLSWELNPTSGLQFYQGVRVYEWELLGSPSQPNNTDFTPNSGRGPGAVVAYIEDAQEIGVSKFHNSPGELFFTLKNSHPYIDAIQPWQSHWALEVRRGQGWTELNEGWITDLDSTDQETVFYGLDYLGVLSLLVDERFNPEQAPDAVAALYPDDAAGTGGSKYVENTIAEIVTDQLDRAINSPHSEVGFITRGAIATMDETVTIFCTLKERLSFIQGLIDSHRAGTGKKTRVQVKKTRNWVDTRAWTPSWAYTVLDDPGEDREDMRFSYGEQVQGYRVIPMGDFATRVLAIGKTSTGFRLEYHIQPTPAPAGEDESFNENKWGRLNKVNFWEDIIDLNDLKRRSLQYASQVGAVGKRVGIGIRVDSLSVEDGWDICDSVPVDITRGPLDTSTYGNGLWTIWGWAALFRKNGYSEATLTLLPKDVGTTLADGLDTASVPSQPTPIQVHDTDPDTSTDTPAGPGVWINSDTGHIWIVDPETGEWVDMTASGDFTALGNSIVVPLDHGAMGSTEAFDYADSSWHRATFDDDCAITVQGFTADQAQVMVIELDDTTGPHSATWDPDIIWFGNDQPPQSASWEGVVLLFSSVGDTTIRGAWIGAGGLTIQDEGVDLATLAEVLNFVGAGVTVTGTGTTKTITITGLSLGSAIPLEDADTGSAGTSTDAAHEDHVHPSPAGLVGELLISDTHSTPLIFDDIMQNEDEDDLLYGNP